MKRWFIFAVLLLLLVSGCKKIEQPIAVPEGRYQVFYLDTAENRMVSEGFNPVKTAGEELLAELFRQLYTPTVKEYVSAIPAAINVPKIELGADGLATLLFDESYTGVSGIKEVLMRAAIVKTLCQSEEVDSLEFYVAGQPLMSGQSTPIGLMKAEDFLESTRPNDEAPQRFSANIYYTDKSGTVLLSSSMTISYTGKESKELAVLRQLIEGPSERGMYPVVSDKLQVLSVTTRDGICTVDFNSKFIEKQKGVSGEVIVYAVVNSLTDLPEVQKVQFLINGKVYKLFQKMDLSLTYERNLNIVENE